MGKFEQWWWWWWWWWQRMKLQMTRAVWSTLKMHRAATTRKQPTRSLRITLLLVSMLQKRDDRWWVNWQQHRQTELNINRTTLCCYCCCWMQMKARINESGADKWTYKQASTYRHTLNPLDIRRHPKVGLKWGKFEDSSKAIFTGAL